VTAKSNEIPAVRDLLKAFTGLTGAVVTIGALHAQSDTAQVITSRGADYVMTVKRNIPTLYRQLKNLPWARIPAVLSVSTDHAAGARRRIKVALAPAWIEFAGTAKVAQLRCTVTKKGKKTVEVTYLIGDSDARAATPAAWVRGPWEIDNKLTESVLRGASDCCTMWHWSVLRRAFASHLAGVVLVIVADQKPSQCGPATCATPSVATASG
jgi:predicted transposase YbfD/YdcC